MTGVCTSDVLIETGAAKCDPGLGDRTGARGAADNPTSDTWCNSHPGTPHDVVTLNDGRFLPKCAFRRAPYVGHPS